jgi:hypothetical protein
MDLIPLSIRNRFLSNSEEEEKEAKESRKAYGQEENWDSASVSGKTSG